MIHMIVTAIRREVQRFPQIQNLFQLFLKTVLISVLIVTCIGTSSSVSFDIMPQVGIDEMVGGQAAVLPTYDETALCSGAFRVLRSMVNAWIRDVSLHRNVFADFQIVHFYRCDLFPTYSDFLVSAVFRDKVHHFRRSVVLKYVISPSHHFVFLLTDFISRMVSQITWNFTSIPRYI